MATAASNLKKYLTNFNYRYMLDKEIKRPHIHQLYQTLIKKHELSLHEYYPCCLLSPLNHRAIGVQFPIWQLWVYDRFLFNQTNETFSLTHVLNEAQRYFPLTSEASEIINEYLLRLVQLGMVEQWDVGYRVLKWEVPVKCRTRFYQLRIGLYLSQYQEETNTLGISYTQLMDTFSAYKKHVCKIVRG